MRIQEINQIAAHDNLRPDHWTVFFFALLDSAIIVLCLAAAIFLYHADWDADYGIAALLAVIVFFLLAEIGGLYRFFRGETLTRQMFRIFAIWMGTVFVLLLTAYAFKVSQQYSRVTVGIWLLTTPLALTVWRIVVRSIYQSYICQERFQRKVLVWGYGDVGERIASVIEKSPWLGLRLTEYIRADDAEYLFRESAHPPSEEGREVVRRLEKRAKRGDFDILYIALPVTARSEIVDLIDRLADSTVSIYMVPDFFTTTLFHGNWSNLDGIPVISVYDTPFWGADGWVKRLEDFVLSCLFLLIAALPMLLIAVAVKATSPGPVFFRQRRYGMDGKQISVWKFRTMSVCEDGPNVPQAKRCDPRVTRIGAFLRRTSLDELPQFFNVFFGDMSIVGPRPHAVAHNELYRKQIKGYMLRHKVRPGITGWAQINGWRGETDDLYKMEKRVEHDLWYIRNWSLWLDLKIIVLTAVHGFVGRNAY